MNVINGIDITGTLEIRDRKTGELVREVKNIIVNLGLAQAMALLGNAAAEPLSRACIGTGAVGAGATDADLGAQVDFQTATYSAIQTAVAGDTAQFVSVHTAPVGGWAITEYGIKTSAGILFNRVVFAVINLAVGNELEFTYKVQATRV
jgi:hypothetical protein